MTQPAGMAVGSGHHVTLVIALILAVGMSAQFSAAQPTIVLSAEATSISVAFSNVGTGVAQYCAKIDEPNTTAQPYGRGQLPDQCGATSPLAVTGLQEYTQYTITGYTIATAVPSADSTVMVITTLTAAPSAAPTSFTATPVPIPTVDLAWAAIPAIDINGVFSKYTITYSINGSSTNITVDTTATAQRLLGLIPNAAYTFHIAVVSSGGTGPSASVTATTIQDFAPAPTGSIGNVDKKVTVDLVAVGGYYIFKEFLCDFVRTQIIGVPSAPTTTTRVTSVSSPVVLSPADEHANYTITCATVNTRAGGLPTGGYPGHPLFLYTTTNATAPSAAPTGLITSSIANNAIDLAWTDINPLDYNGIFQHFQLTYTTAGSSPVTTTAASNSSMISSLTIATMYTITVAVVSSGGIGPVAMINASTTQSGPVQPTTSASETATAITVVVSVSNAAEFVPSFYCVTFTRSSVSGVADSPAVVTTVCNSTSTVTLSPAEEDAMYSYVAVVNNTAGVSSSMSGASTVTTQSAAPSRAPTGLMTTATSNTAITLTWTNITALDYNGAFQNFQLRYTASGSSPMTTTSATSSITISSLMIATLYTVTVAVVSSGGTGPAANITVSTTQSGPMKPTVSASATATSITVAVSVGNSADFIPSLYCVTFTRSSVSGSPEIPAVVAMVCNSTSTVTLSSTEEDAMYSYVAVVNNTAGVSSPMSDISNISTLTAPPSAAVTQLSASAITASSVRLIWMGITHYQLNGRFFYYRVQYTAMGLSTPVTLPQLTSAFVTVTGLTYSTQYTFYVAVVSSGGRGPDATVMATTIQSAPSVAPAGLTASVITANSMTLMWIDINSTDLNGAFQNFQVQYTMAGSSSTTTLTPSPTTTNAMVTGLMFGTQYNVTVAVVSSGGVGPTATLIVTTIVSMPSSAPTSLMTSAISGTSVTLTWADISPSEYNGVTRNFLLKYTSNGSTKSTNASSSPMLTISTLSPATKYSFTVAAVSSGGVGPDSIAVNVTTSQGAPQKPTISSTPTATSIAVMVSVANTDFIPSLYCVTFTRSSVSGVTDSPAVVTTVCNSTSTVTLSPAQEDAMYSFEAVVNNTAGVISPVSSPSNVSTPIAAPSAAPTGLRTEAVTDTTISLTWTDISYLDDNGAFQRFQVVYSITGDSFSQDGGSPTTNSVLVSSLAHLTSYTFTVYVVASGGDGPHSLPLTVSTAQSLPPAPTISLVVSAATSFTVTVRVTAGNFRISKYCCNFTRTMVSGVGLPLPTVTVCSDATVIALSGIEEDATYTVSAFANNTAGGVGPGSATRTEKTLVAAPSSAPEGVSVSTITATTATVTWSPPPLLQRNGPISNYLVFYNEPGKFAKSATSTSTTTNITGLTFLTSYDIQVAAVTTGGRGPSSVALRIATIQAVPPAPTVSSSSTTTTSITVVLNAVTGDFNVGQYCGKFTRTMVSGTPLPLPVVTVCSSSVTLMLSGIEEDATYTVLASVNNTGGQTGPDSTMLSISTSNAVPASAPTNVMKTSDNATSVSIAWTAVPVLDFNGIFIVYEAKFGRKGMAALSTLRSTSTSVVIGGLSFDTTYTVQIAVVSQGGTGPLSTIIDASTSQDTPPMPTLALSRTSTSISAVFSVTAGLFTISKYCGTFTRTMVSGQTMDSSGQALSLPAVMLCSDTTTVGITGIEEDATYTITGIVNNTAGQASPNSALMTITTMATPPSVAPGNLHETGSNATAVTLVWDAVAFLQLNGALVKYNVNYTNPGIMSVDETSRTITISGLTFATSYQVQVAAVSTGGTGPYTSVTVMTAQDIPPAPTATFSTTTTSMTAMLTVVPGDFRIDQYCAKFTRTMVSGQSMMLPVVTLCSSTAMVTLTGTEEDSQYSVAVFVNNTASQPGPDSTPYTVNTLAAAPALAPGSVTETDRNATAVVLTWTAVSLLQLNGMFLTYSIKYTVGSAPMSVNETTTTITINGLVFATTYTVEIAAVSTGGTGPYAPITATTLQAVPPAPMAVFSTTTTSITATLTVVPGHFHIDKRCAKFTRTMVSGQSSLLPAVTMCSSTAMVTLTGTEEDSQYSVAVFVNNTASQTGPESNPYTATTLAAAPSLAPGGLRQTARTATTVTLTWNVVAFLELNGVFVKYNINYTSSAKMSMDVTSKTITISGLTFASTYIVQVAAVSTGGTGPYASISATTSQDTPPAPTAMLSTTSTSIAAMLAVVPGNFRIDQYCAKFTRTMVSGQSMMLPVVTLCSSTAMVTLTGTEEDSQYSVAVFVNNTAGQTGPDSTTYTANTLAAAPSLAPGGLRQTARTATTVTLTWNAVAFLELNGVFVKYNINYTSSAKMSVDVTSGIITISGLTFASTYIVQVAAVSTGGTGPYASISATTSQDTPPAPTATFSTTSTSIAAMLTVVPGNFRIDQYCAKFTRTMVSGQSMMLPVVTLCSSTSTVTLPATEEDSQYSVAVYVNNTAGQTGPDSTPYTVNTLATAPSVAPGNLRQTARTATTVTLMWDAVAFLQLNGVFAKYNVNYTNSGKMSVDETSRSITISGLTFASTYQVQVAAVSTGGTGPYNAVNAMTSQDIPPAPTVIFSTTTTSITATLAVTAGNFHIDKYCAKFSRTKVSGQAYVLPEETLCSSATMVTLTGTEEDAEYNVIVFVNNTASQASPDSSTLTANTMPAAPILAPGSVTETDRNATAVVLAWTAVGVLQLNGMFLRYNIKYTVGSNPMSVDETATTITINGLVFATTYTVQVAAVSTGGTGPYASITATTLQDVPPAPTATFVPTPTSITATLSVTPGHFQLAKYCASFSRTQVSGVSLPLAAVTLCSSTRMVVLTGIEEDAKYNIIAFVNNTASQTSSNSAMYTADTVAAAPATPPGGITDTGRTATTITISWTPVPLLQLNGRFVNFNIQYNVNKQARSTTVTVPTVTVSGLTFATTYQIRVAAVSTGGTGPYTAINATTVQDVPPAPTAAFASTPTSITATLSVTPGQFQLARYCAKFTRTRVSGAAMALAPVTRCSSTSMVVLPATQEDADYDIVAFVNNTARSLSPDSVMYTASTLPIAPTTAPSSLRAAAMNATSITVTWSTVPLLELNGRLLGYNIMYYTPTSATVSVNSTTTRVVLTGLQFATQYTILVGAISTGGIGITGFPFTASTLQDTPPAPTVAFASTSTSITATLTVVRGNFHIDKYCADFSRTLVSGVAQSSPAVRVCSITSMVVLSGIQEDATYSVTEFVNNTAGSDGPISSAATTKTQYAVPSGPPQAFSVSGITMTTFDLSWQVVLLLDRNGPIQTYQIMYGKNVTASGLTTTITGLLPNRTYSVSIAAVGATNQTGPATSLVVQTLEAIPDPPLLASSPGKRNVTVTVTSRSLNWTVSMYCAGIAAVPVSGQSWTMPAQFTPRQDCSSNAVKMFDNLEEYTDYTVFAYAINTVGGAGGNTSRVVRTQQDRPSSAPQGLALRTTPSISASSIPLRWMPPLPINLNGIITTYMLNVMATFPIRTTFTVLVPQPMTLTVLTDVRIRPYTDYRISVAASTSVGIGPYSAPPLSVKTSEAAPVKAPVIMSSMYVTSTSLRLTWAALAQSDLNGVLAQYTISYTDGNTRAEVTSRTTSVDITNLRIFTNYTLQVRAVNGAGNGPYSMTVTQATDQTTPSVVTGVKVMFSTNTTAVVADVSWTPLDSSRGIITQYIVTYQQGTTPGATKETVRVDGTASQAVVTGLVEKTGYTFYVTASTVRGLGTDSSMLPTNGAANQPGQPMEIMVSFPSNTEALVEWTHSKTGGQPDMYDIIAFYEVNVAGRRRRRAVAIRNITTSVSPSESSGRISGLTPGTGYAFDVIAVVNYDGMALRSPSVVNPNKLADSPTYQQSPPEKSSVVPIAAGAAGAVVVILIVIIIIIVVRRRSTKTLKFSDTPARNSVRSSSSGDTVQLRTTNFSGRKPGGDGFVMENQASERESPSDEVKIVICEGCMALLPCGVTGEPRPTISWMRNNELVNTKLGASRFSVLQDGSLQIDDTTMKDAGEYRCVASNRDGSASLSVTLVVETPENLKDLPGTPARRRTRSVSQAGLHAVAPGAFGKHIKKMHASDNSGFQEEFKTLSSVGSTQPKTIAAKYPAKNRYANIGGYDHSLVFLPMIDGREETTYINATYIDGFRKPKAYIATQGPTPHTVNDFWRMVWSEEVPMIIMLTKCVEMGKRKCEEYWPSESKTYQDIRVTHVDTQSLAEYTIRQFKLEQGKESRVILHCHFTAWPDHDVPKYATGLLNFLKRVKTEQEKPDSAKLPGPLLVHCSAGVGRTGTLIAIDTQTQRAAADQDIDVHTCIQAMRTRRQQMVQTLNQYMFVHDAILEGITCGSTQMQPHDMRLRLNRLTKPDPKTKLSIANQHMATLESLSPQVGTDSCSAAHRNGNREKNRYMEFLPLDTSRVLITGTNDLSEYQNMSAGPIYINASYIDGFRTRDMFIATQGPLSNTVTEFWAMNWENSVFSIINLTQLIENGEEMCARYWPAKGSETYGHFVVEVSSEQRYSEYMVVKLKVTNNKQEADSSRTITLFHYTAWPQTKCPSSANSLVTLIDELMKVQQQTGNKKIVVHCNDGCGRTGTFLAIFRNLERMKVESIIDVFQAIKSMRTQRPFMVHSVEQYRFVHTAILDYLQSLEGTGYDNFKM